jgi:putative membrane protein
MFRTLLLVLKGMCMGAADVVPGVSGGTMALILGIYVQFVDGIRSLHLRWVPLLFRWAAAGFGAREGLALRDSFLEMHFGFLIPLAAGIVMAFGVGSVAIPWLMDAFPEGMRAFFLGLILASTWLPMRAMQTRGARELVLAVVAAALTWGLLGLHTEPALQWRTVEVSERMSLEDLNRHHPSVRTPEQLYCGHQEGADNTALRLAIQQDPEQRVTAAELDRICAGLAERQADIRAWMAFRTSIGTLGRKHPGNPFHHAVVPAGTPVQLPAPALWYVAMCGFIGICAMVLPGISGSFLLLVLGVYHFLLSGALKGLIKAMLHGDLPLFQLMHVSAFGIGCVLGLLSFARVVSWLFRQHNAPTLAVMLGLMVGSLRAIWPFQMGDASVGIVNTLPSDPGAWFGVSMAFGVGLMLVLGLTAVSSRLEARLAEMDRSPLT